jgi:hypothetical protein
MVKNSAKKCIISKIVKQIGGTITAARPAKGQLWALQRGKSTFLRPKERVLKKINSFAAGKAGHYFAQKGKLRTPSAFPPLRNNCHPYLHAPR